jgi:CheY-like chemotaxis protein
MTVAILNGAKILLVEDVALINLAMGDALKEMGCHVASCMHLDQAWKSVEYSEPDAAVLDVNLHDKMTSYELADWLHERGIPIVFLTGYEAPTLHGKWSGHQSCIKPCPPAELRKLLVAALAQKRSPQDLSVN